MSLQRSETALGHGAAAASMQQAVRVAAGGGPNTRSSVAAAAAAAVAGVVSPTLPLDVDVHRGGPVNAGSNSSVLALSSLRVPQPQQQQQQHQPQAQQALAVGSHGGTALPPPAAFSKQTEFNDDMQLALSQEVRNHPCLYGALDGEKKGEKRGSRQVAWKAVSERVGIPADECQKRFKNLRDRYVKALKEFETSGVHPKWRFFRILGFLKNSVRHRSSFGGSASEPLLASGDGISSNALETSASGSHSDFASISSLVCLPDLSNYTNYTGAPPVQTSSSTTSQLASAESLNADQSSNSSVMSITSLVKGVKRPASGPVAPPAKRKSLGGPMESTNRQSPALVVGDSPQDSATNVSIDLFAASIASQMRQLSPQAVDLAKLRIQQVIFDVKYQSGSSSTSTA